MALVAFAGILLAAAIGLMRVDTGWGAPAGPERLLQSIDAGHLQPAQLNARAMAILRDRPIDGRADRVLAALADRDNDRARAATLYAIAVRRAPRDRVGRAALADRAFAAGDAAGAFVQLDALWRVAPGLAEPLLRALLPAMRNPGMQDALVARLASDPPWRPAIASALRAPVVEQSVALDLLAGIASRMPLTPAERDARIALLQRSGHDAEARRLWLASLPPTSRQANALLFDGGFEHPEIEGAYAWRQAPSPGVDIGVDTSAAEGAQALSLVFSGRAIQTPGLQQSLALAPGAYHLAFAADNATDAQRPFAWRIACRGGEQLLSTELPPAGSSGWQHLRADFVVPDDCTGQTLRLDLLARSLLERQVSGTLRLDAIHIQGR